MKKLLYAIQLKQAEDAITKAVGQYNIIQCGTAPYREAVPASLRESSADILIYRESLKGSADTFDLMFSIRRDFPQTRVVFIANAQPITSPILCKLVFLGIYDIIVKDNPNISDIVDFILNPRDFSYANKFFHPEHMASLLPAPVVEEEESPQGAKKGPLLGLLGRLSGQGSAPTAQQPAQAPELPKVDLETMRGAMLEEARRTAQAEIPMLVETQVFAATASLRQDLDTKTRENAALSQDIAKKEAAITRLKQELENAIELKDRAEQRMADLQKEADFTSIHYKEQLTSLQVTKPPEWYQAQTQKWLAERDDLQSKITALTETSASLSRAIQEKEAMISDLTSQLAVKTEELEALQLSVPRQLYADATLEDDFVMIPDSDSEYRPSPAGDGRMIAFLGSKHGIGNTTVALNTAIALANCGYKTCFIELNRTFPMVTGFFEFNNIVRGLDTAVAAIQQNNPKLASQCIIKPHGIMTSNKAVGKIYKRLPGPLHFLLHSNSFLLQCQAGGAPHITERELKDLDYFLMVQERYSFVVVDLQPDDQASIDVFLGSSFHAHKLILTMTQDPHSITTAGRMITTLSRSRNGGLVRNAEFVLNQYAPNNKLAPNKICDTLHIKPSRMTRISLDPKGYMDACYSMVPYILSKGSSAKEYIDLRMKLTN